MLVDTAADLSRPISTLLREGTSKAHKVAEVSPGAGWLARGELDRDEYVRYLMMLWHIYDALERALDKHASHPTLEPTYNPKTLARTSNLASDIAFLLQCQEATWQSHPAHTGLLLSRPNSFIAYTERLQTLSHSADPSLLLAHAYVRYLGDLSGGQVIRRRVAQAYAIDAENGSGVKFYEFKNLEGTKPGTRGDNKKIKEWYRTGMNAGVRDNETLKTAILEEANKAFELNLNLFDSLKGPTPYTKHLYGSTVSLLGDLESDIDEDAMDSPPSQPKELPIEIIQGNHQERMVSFASVLSVIVAVCLAHFLLVTCGFTGEKWLQKLESLGISVL